MPLLNPAVYFVGVNFHMVEGCGLQAVLRNHLTVCPIVVSKNNCYYVLQMCKDVSYINMNNIHSILISLYM